MTPVQRDVFLMTMAAGRPIPDILNSLGVTLEQFDMCLIHNLEFRQRFVLLNAVLLNLMLDEPSDAEAE